MHSLWQAETEKKSFPPLSGHISTNVAIIGGGMVGILTAFMLKEKGVECIVLEKNSVGCGTTAGTTAKITSQHGLIYHKLIKSSGKDKAKLYYQLNQAAIEKYRRLSEKYPCDFETKDNFIYDTLLRTEIYAELQALNEIGADAELFDSLPLPFNIAGAICFPDQGQFNPLKLLYALAEQLEIYENTTVKDVCKNQVITDKGTVTADKILMAAHFPFIDRRGLYFMKMYQHRSYCIALEKAIQLDGMYLENKKDGLSFRNYGDYLIIGGGDHRTGKNGGCYEVLREAAARYFPQSQERYAWAAQDCISLDSIPYIGNYSKNTPDLYVATGFNKWGMTSSMVAANMLSDMLTDKKHIGQELFSPSRSMLSPQLILNGFESVFGLLTPLPKRCGHLGCALRYNKAEKTWDCSCHGSRYSESGEVIDGPAVR